MLKQFEQYLLEEKHREKSTAHFYCKDIEMFLAHFAGRDVWQLTNADIQAYFDALATMPNHKGKTYKPRTVTRKAASLTTFYKWGIKTGQCATSPILPPGEHHRKLKLPTTTRREFAVLTTKDADRVLSHIESNNEFIELRDRAMFSLLMYCGIRASELQKTRIGDVDIQNHTLTVHRRKTRAGQLSTYVVDISPVRSQVLEYLVQRYDNEAPSEVLSVVRDEYLFINKDGELLSLRSIRRKLGFYAAQAGMKINPSMLVHSFAIKTLQRNRRSDITQCLHDVKERLGHRNIATTREYLSFLNNGRNEHIAEAAPEVEEPAMSPS